MQYLDLNSVILPRDSIYTIIEEKIQRHQNCSKIFEKRC
jgi:hypothetical protein